MGIFWVLMLSMISACLTRAVAKSKGLSVDAWTVAGFALGPLALLAAAGCGDKRQQRILRLLAQKQGIVIDDPDELSRTQFTIAGDANEDQKWTAILNAMPTAYSSSASREKSIISKGYAEIRDSEDVEIFFFENDGQLSDSKSFIWRGQKVFKG